MAGPELCHPRKSEGLPSETEQLVYNLGASEPEYTGMTPLYPYLLSPQARIDLTPAGLSLPGPILLLTPTTQGSAALPNSVRFPPPYTLTPPYIFPS